MRALNGAGIDTIINKAIGPYNADIGAGSVAVEIFGGTWHGGGRPAEIFPKRSRYILDAGWHLVIVWITKFFAFTENGANHIISFIEETSRNESAVREYRVIGGDGQLLASQRGDFDDFPFIPPGK